MSTPFVLLFLPTLKRRLPVVFFFFFHTIAAQKIRQALRKRRARHHHVASRFDGLHLQVALEMVEEADDRNGFLEFGFEFGNQRHGLGVQVVEIEDQ